MELNKYDLVEYLVSHFEDIQCDSCPIMKECDEREKRDGSPMLCQNKDEARETLIKKYNL